MKFKHNSKLPRSTCKQRFESTWHLSQPPLSKLVKSNSVASPGANFINLAVILINANGRQKDVETFLNSDDSPLLLQLGSVMGSIVRETSSPLHLVLITEPGMISSINRVLKTKFGSLITAGVLLNKKRATRFPQIRVTLVDIRSVIEGHEDHLNSMKQLFSRIKNNLLLMPGDRKFPESNFYNTNGR